VPSAQNASTFTSTNRRLVEDLWRVDVNRVAGVEFIGLGVCGLLIQVEARSCSDLVDDGAFLRLSLPGLPTTSRTWRLVPVSQARSGVPDFDRSCSWWVVGNDGRRYRHLYFWPDDRRVWHRTDLNLKYGCSDGREEAAPFPAAQDPVRIETCRRHRKRAD